MMRLLLYNVGRWKWEDGRWKWEVNSFIMNNYTRPLIILFIFKNAKSLC